MRAIASVLAIYVFLWVPFEISNSWAAESSAAEETTEPDSPVQLSMQETVTEKDVRESSMLGNRPELQLSLTEAVRLTLAKSLGLQVRGVEKVSAQVAVEAAKAGFDPFFQSSLAVNGSERTATSFFEAGSSQVESKSATLNTSLTQPLQMGGSFRIALNTQRDETNSNFSILPSSYSSSLTATLSYPLLRDKGSKSIKIPIEQAKNNVSIAELRLLQEAINAVARTQNAYLDLILARERLKVQLESLSLAKNLLEIAQAQERVGTLAPIEVLSAESGLAAREEGVILAESTVLSAEDALRTSLNLPEDLSKWDVAIIPTDSPSVVEQQTFNFESAVKKAFEHRPDYLQFSKNMDSIRLGLDLARDRIKPELGLSSSFGFLGNSQTGAALDSEGEVIAGPQGGIFGSHLEDFLSMRNFQWSVGVSISQFFGNKAAQGNYRSNKLNLERTLIELRSLELSIVSEVRTLLRNIETGKKRIVATKVAAELAKRRLEAEQKKFEVGTATSFDVLQFQEQYVAAETAQTQSIIDLNRSILLLQQALGLTLEANGIDFKDGQPDLGKAP